MIWLAVAVAGALGAACRYVLDHAVTVTGGGRLPLGTALVNVSGSFAAGLVAGLAARHLLPADSVLVIAGGFLGAYTTFSTAMYQSLRLWEAGARPTAAVNLLGPLLSAAAAVTLGWWVAM